MFKVLISTMYAITHACACLSYVCVNACVCICLSEMNDSNDTRDRREQVGLFCFNNFCRVIVIGKHTWISCNYVLRSLGQSLNFEKVNSLVRERHTERFVVPLIYSVIVWFLHVPNWKSKPTEIGFWQGQIYFRY